MFGLSGSNVEYIYRNDLGTDNSSEHIGVVLDRLFQKLLAEKVNHDDAECGASAGIRTPDPHFTRVPL